MSMGWLAWSWGERDLPDGKRLLAVEPLWRVG